jgi:nucleoside-diphosphate-sugar epimerase
MRILVTGGTGFVGRHLVPALAATHEVTCIVRDASGTGVPSTVQLLEADLADPGFGDRLPQEIDVVVHLAQAYASFPDRATDLFLVNAASTHWLAEWARRSGVARFVLASSGSIYRPAAEPLTEDAPTLPAGYHPATKLVSELILDHYRPYLDVAVLRLFAPYGRGQTNRMIPRMFEAIRAGAPITLSRGGEPRINPIHVDDLVAIMVHSVEDAGNYTVNVGGDEPVSIRQLAEMIGSEVGRAPVFVDRDGEVPGDLVADTTRMRRIFGPREMTPLARGLHSMVGDDVVRPAR